MLAFGSQLGHLLFVCGAERLMLLRYELATLNFSFSELL